MDTANQGRAADLNEAAAAEIRAQLARRRMRQSTFAHQLGVTEVWLSRRLRGIQKMSLDEFEAIAKALDMEPVELLRLARSGTAQMNKRSLSVPERSPGGPLAPPARPADNRPDGRPHSSMRRPERVSRHPIAA